MVDIITHVLLLHNTIRSNIGLPQLVIDNELCKLAQEWADIGVKTGTFKHTPNHKYGENIAWKVYPKDYPVVKYGSDIAGLFTQWVDEEVNYQQGTWPHNAKNKSKEVGHYSQLVWKDTKRLGVGYGKTKEYSYLVCFYDPPGNITGQKGY